MALVSAVLSTLGLLAVSVSLMYQSHQAKIAQMLGSRALHVELRRLMLDYPSLDFNYVGDSDDASEDYLSGMSMWMSHWNTMWHIKKMDEKALRFMTADLFTRRAAREWWTKVGATWSSRSSRSERRFIEIVTAECIAASASALLPVHRARSTGGGTSASLPLKSLNP